MQPQIALREVAVAAAYFVYLGQIAGHDLHTRPDAVTITLNADRFDQHGIVRIATIVAQQLRPAIQIVDDHVDIAIIIYIAEGGSPARVFFRKRSAQLCGHFGKGPVAIVLVNEIALAVAWQLGVDVAVDDKQINPTIVVIVKELGSPTHVRKTYRGDFSSVGNVGERIEAVVMVERVVVVVEIGYEQVEPPVMVVVAYCYAHASLLAAVLVDCRARRKSDLLKRAVPVIVVEEIRRRVVSDKNINQTVSVKVAANDSQPIITIRVRDASLF